MTVQVSDIETALGRTLTDLERAQVDQRSSDALMLIEARLGNPLELNQRALQYVVREAVVTRFRNPDGYQSETIDDYTYRFGSETRKVTILDEWWDLLRPTTRGAGFSTRPTFELDCPSADPWRPL